MTGCSSAVLISFGLLLDFVLPPLVKQRIDYAAYQLYEIICAGGLLGGLLGGSRRRSEGGGVGSRGATPGLSVGRVCAATVWARSLTRSGLLTLRGVVLALVRRGAPSARPRTRGASRRRHLLSGKEKSTRADLALEAAREFGGSAIAMRS